MYANNDKGYKYTESEEETAEMASPERLPDSIAAPNSKVSRLYHVVSLGDNESLSSADTPSKMGDLLVMFTPRTTTCTWRVNTRPRQCADWSMAAFTDTSFTFFLHASIL